MKRTVLLLGILALLGGAAAWLILGRGGDLGTPAGLPGREGAGTSKEKKGPSPSPLPAARRRVGREKKVRLPGSGPGKAGGRRLNLLLTCSALGGVQEGVVFLVSAGGKILARSRAGKDGRATLEVPPSAGKALLRVDSPRCLPWSAPLPEKRSFFQVDLEAAAFLSGKVLGRDGNPAAGARVFLEPGPAGGRGPSCRTGRDGSFRLERVPPGKVKVTCLLGGESRTKVVSLEKGGKGEVFFDFTPKGPLLEGFLSDSSGLPLPGWWLEVLDVQGEGRVLARTGRDGEFQVELPRPSKVDLFAAGKKDPAQARVFLGSFQVGEGGLAGLRLSLGRGGIRGRVVLGEGGDLPDDLQVAAWRMEGGGFRLAGQVGAFDPEGRFSLDGLREGSYRLLVRARGYPDLLTWVGPVGAGTKDVGILALTRKGAGDLLFRCKGKGGPPPRSFQAWRREGDAWIPLDLLPRGRRRFLARALPAGKVGLRIEAEGFVPGELDVTIAPGKVSKVTLEFVRGYPVTLQVTLRGGGEAKKLFGRFSRKGPWIAARPAGPGLWTFPSLPPGSYTLLVKAPGFPVRGIPVRVPAREVPAARVELFR